VTAHAVSDDQLARTLGLASNSITDDLERQVLRPDGSVNHDSGLDVDLDPDLVRSLYRDMVVVRRLDQEAFHLQRQGQLGLWLSCRGQEAAQVGSARATQDRDWIFPAYREHGVGVVRGVTPAELLSQWRGCSHGGWDPAKYRMHINSLVLGTQTLHATGYAMGVQADGADEVVIVYVGDGATSQGDVNEALNWAAVTGVPLVFFCQNNQWAISTRVDTQTARPLYHRAAAFGLDSICVDGNDVLAVHAATSAMFERVRAGGAPGFIEARTYRMAGHSTSDDPTRYRDDEEMKTWESRDPLERVRMLLDNNGWSDPAWLAEVETESDQIAAETRAACLSLPEPQLEDSFDHTYVEPTVALRQERAGYVTYQESFQ